MQIATPLFLCFVTGIQPGGLDVLEIFNHLGPIGWTVVGLLFLMSVWSLGVILDRALMYAAARRQSRAFIHQVAAPLRDGRFDEAMQIAERNKKSHIAKITASGLAEFQHSSPRMNEAKAMEFTRRTMERSVAIVHAEFERGLASLATIGSTAPFVGLFGTVVGILRAFKAIELNKGATGFSAVAGGISEALVTTALGLLVAIPAVWAFNIFTNKLKFLGVEMDNSSAELVNYFASRFEDETADERR